jgi:hypothetical protein
MSRLLVREATLVAVGCGGGRPAVCVGTSVSVRMCMQCARRKRNMHIDASQCFADPHRLGVCTMPDRASMHFATGRRSHARVAALCYLQGTPKHVPSTSGPRLRKTCSSMCVHVFEHMCTTLSMLLCMSVCVHYRQTKEKTIAHASKGHALIITQSRT